jgi:replication initiation protein RepC
MEQVYVSTVEVEAQESCVSYNEHLETSPGTIAEQPGFAPILRRELMAAVNTVAKDFGLRASSVVVLDALLSWLPCRDKKTGRDTPITNGMLLTVFASNDTLCFRAKGLTDRQLRRHLERLERVGLIRRRDSANGKRFPIYRNGKIAAAFGIDLSPLLELSGKLVDLAQKARDSAAELRGVKARIHKVRAMCMDLTLDETTKCFVEGVSNTLRRVGTTVTEAKAILASLLALIERNSANEQPTENDLNLSKTTIVAASKTPANDGQNVRHKEPEKPDKKNIKASRQPEVVAEIRTSC